jgi:hypothetical protein
MSKKLLIALFVAVVLAFAFGQTPASLSNSNPPAPTGYLLATIQKDTSAHTASVAIPNPVVSCIGATQPTCGTSVTLPACLGGGTGSTRGWYWDTQGTTGVKDSVQVCAKDAADAYAWRTIY